MSANDNTLKASSTGNLFGTTANSDAPKGTFPNTTGFSGFGSSSSTTSKAPSAKGLFGMNDGSQSNNSSKAPSASSPFGTKAVSLNSEILESTSSTYSLGTAESLSSSTTGGLFGTNPSPWNTQIPETTATGIPNAAVQPSSLTTTGSVFGTATTSTESGPSQSATGFSGFGTSSSTPRGAFGTNATTSTSHDTFRVTKPMPTASNVFSAFRETSTRTPFGSTSITETTSTSKPMTSTAPGVLTSADSAQTDSLYSNPFQASYWLNKDNPSAHQSPSRSSAPKRKSRSPLARDEEQSFSETCGGGNDSTGS